MNSAADAGRRLGRRGVTLYETLIAVFLFGLVALMAGPSIRNWSLAGVSVEARASLVREMESSLGALESALSASRRLFTRNDAAFLARLDLTGGPALLSGSRLPRIEREGSLSLSAANFVPGSIGNTLFFARSGAAKDFSIPLTGGGSASVRIDTYRFHLYYLSPESQATLGGRPRLKLYHWISGSYADADQLRAVSHEEAATGVRDGLIAAGLVTAWDLNETDVNAAFFTIQSAGLVAQPSHTVARAELKTPVAMFSRTGFSFGVSPNTSVDFNPPDVVPRYATAAPPDFPSGFEVAIVGSVTATRVLVRHVMAARTPAGKTFSHEVLSITGVSDQW